MFLDLFNFIVGLYLGFWKIRNFITFIIRSQYGKIVWAFDKFSMPMPKKSTIGDLRIRSIIGIGFILFGVLLIVIPLNILLGLGIGFLCGGLWELIISLIAVVTIKDELVPKKYFDDLLFSDEKFNKFCLALKRSLASNKWVYTVRFTDGMEFMGFPTVNLHPFNMLLFFNSEKSLSLILYHFDSSLQYFIYDGNNLILKDVVNSFVLIKSSDYSELKYP